MIRELLKFREKNLTVKPGKVMALSFPFKLLMLMACIKLRTTVLGD
jgi:hypothetical protein